MSLYPPENPTHVLCDGCGKTFPLSKEGESPKKWEQEGSPPPGWEGKRLYSETLIKREDFCLECAFARL